MRTEKRRAGRPHPLFLLTTVESDAHTWNLVYIETLLEEHGVETINLGPCVPAEMTIEAIVSHRPDGVIVSSVNGHGFLQGRALYQLAAEHLGDCLPPMLIGGKLSTTEENGPALKRELLALGFEGVFVGRRAIPEFRRWLTESFSAGYELAASAP